jgi:putative tryptophan/tyrosine transport system substrate-binding protein
VFSAAADPVEIGLVPSLSQPGGNVTGMGIFNASLGTKHLELIKELLPNASVVGYLLNPANSHVRDRDKKCPRSRRFVEN